MALPPFRLERYFARHEFSARHLLCASDCESFTVHELLEREPDATERFGQLRLGYTESQGSPSLRREIARLYVHVTEDGILVHAGAEEAIFNFMLATLRRGDHVIVHWPCYQSLVEVALGAGGEVTHWNASEERGWALDTDDLRRAIRPNTKVIVLNTPHNPTGYLMPRDTFLDVAQLAEAHGIVLFSDEVYRELEHVPEHRLPPAADVSETAVSLGVMSKTYGLPGLRIGWVATRNRGVLEAMAMQKDYTTICSSAPSEWLAELALRHRGAIVERNRGIVLQNLDTLDAFFARHADRFVWRRPHAGPIAFPRLVGGQVERFCDELIQRTGVLLLPGTVYGDQGEHFRVGFGRRSLDQALDRLDGYLQSAIPSGGQTRGS